MEVRAREEVSRSSSRRAGGRCRRSGSLQFLHKKLFSHTPRGHTHSVLSDKIASRAPQLRACSTLSKKILECQMHQSPSCLPSNSLGLYCCAKEPVFTQHCLSASQSVEVAPAPVAISILTSAGFAVMLLPRLLPPLFVMLPLDADPLYFVSSLLSLTIFEMASPEEPSSRDTVYVLSFGSYALTVHSD